MTRLFLVRHGQSEGNIDKTVYFTVPDHKVTLTDLGRTQAAEAGKELADKLMEKAVVFLSPYDRARETYDIMSKSLKNISSIQENPLLREQEYKVFSSMEDYSAVHKVKKAFGDFFYRYKRAESKADVYQRVFTFVNHLLLLKTLGKLDNNVIIVGHEIMIQMMLKVLDGSKYDETLTPIENCEIVERVL